jgi:hypothetical protein
LEDTAGLPALEFSMLILAQVFYLEIVKWEDFLQMSKGLDVMFRAHLYTLAITSPPSGFRLSSNWHQQAHAAEFAAVPLLLLGNDRHEAYEDACELYIAVVGQLADSPFPTLIAESMRTLIDDCGRVQILDLAGAWVCILTHSTSFSPKLHVELLERSTVYYITRFMVFLSKTDSLGHNTMLAVSHPEGRSLFLCTTHLSQALFCKGGNDYITLAIRQGILKAIYCIA